MSLSVSEKIEFLCKEYTKIMRWVYILKCEDDHYYVGETSRLFRRFWEHDDGRGGVNTLTYPPEGIVAIYKVDTIGKFMEYTWGVSNNDRRSFLRLRDFNDPPEDYYEYNNRQAEKDIAECMMMHNKDNWNQIRGGKYTRFDCTYEYPNNKHAKDLPLCKCGLPCDIRKNEDGNYLFFRCAKKNMWDDFREEFDIEDKPCNYFMKYTKDNGIQNQETRAPSLAGGKCLL